jgi:hypothetical protein
MHTLKVGVRVLFGYAKLHAIKLPLPEGAYSHHRGRTLLTLKTFTAVKSDVDDNVLNIVWDALAVWLC